MFPFKLRVTIDREDRQVFRDMEVKYFSKYVRAEEVGKDTGKSHYHYYIETDRPNPLRQYIQKYIGKGNGFYSLKRVDEFNPVEYLSYIIKEDNNSVWFNMDDDIRENVKVYASEVKHQIKSVRKEGKLSKIRLYILETNGFIPLNPETLVELIVEYHISNRLMINKFHIINYAQTILVETDEKYKKSFIQDCVIKMSS